MIVSAAVNSIVCLCLLLFLLGNITIYLRLYVSLSASVFVRSVRLPVRPSVGLAACLFVCLSICLSVWLFISCAHGRILFDHLCIELSSQSAHPSVCLSVCICLYLFACQSLFVYLSISTFLELISIYASFCPPLRPCIRLPRPSSPRPIGIPPSFGKKPPCLKLVHCS